MLALDCRKGKIPGEERVDLISGHGGFPLCRWKEKIAGWKVFVPQKLKDKQGRTFPLQ